MSYVVRESLSTCESMIMKVIWDQKKDATIQQLVNLIQERYQNHYKRATVVTFLSRLSSKGFISTYRSGKYSYIHPEKDVEEYEVGLAVRNVDFWFDGKLSGFLAALSRCQKFSKEEIRQVRGILNDLDC